MAAYKQQYFTWIGHSVNDTPPAASTVTGQFKFDTDLLVMSYSDGTSWNPYAYGPNAVAELKNKTMDVLQNNFLKFARIGAYSPTAGLSTPNDTWGVLRGMVSVGIPQNKNLGTFGVYHRYSTYGTTTDDVAGVLKLDGYTTMRFLNGKIRFGVRYNPNTGNTRRMFVGYGAQRMVTLTSDTAPLTNSEHGFLFGHGAADTQFQIFHNDGTGACQKTTFGVNLPAVATNYILEITANDTAGSFTASLFNVATGGFKSTAVGSPVTISSRIPGSQIGLYMQYLVVATTTPQQHNDVYLIEVY